MLRNINVLAFVEKAVKKVLASLEMCWHFQKELLKFFSKHRKVLAFTKGAVKKVFVSLEMCRHLLKEL